MREKIEYFAGANSKNGYTSYFHRIVGNKYKKVYILKGSAGCGKSTFMKRVGEKALRKGLYVEFIRCSADSRSVDGILIPDMGFAIIDGTAPHIMNVKYPSARENIINLGEFWDEKKLRSSRDTLISLTDRKLFCYDNIYRALSAAGSIRDIRAAQINKTVQTDKLSAFANRICSKLILPSSGEERVRIQTAYNQNGFDSLPTFSSAKNIYLIRDKYDIACLLLGLIRSYAERIGAERVVSYDPIDLTKPEAVYFPSGDILFVPENRFVVADNRVIDNKPINTARFIDKKAFSEIRQKDRALFKLYNALLDTAKQYFTEAADIHDSIERIYIRAMNFEKLTDFTNKFIRDLFG